MPSEKGSALRKGLNLLEALAAAEDGLTARDLAERLNLHKTNVYRYLKVLQETRYVRRDEKARFHLGFHVLELGAQLLRRVPLREAAHAHLVHLSRATEKTIHLSVLEDADILYVDKVEGPQTLPMRSRIGTRVPAYCTASGKVLLAALPPGELHRTLEGLDLVRRTPATIVDRARLEEELRACAARGYAIDHGENEEHICCFAAPIYDQSGRAVAAISLTGLAAELIEPEEQARLRRLVLKTARAISGERGYAPEAETNKGTSATTNERTRRGQG